MAECIKYEYGIEDFQGRVPNYTRVEQAVLDSAVNTLKARETDEKEGNVCALHNITSGADARFYNVYLNRGCVVLIRKRRDRDSDTSYSNSSMSLQTARSNKGGLEKVANELKLPTPKF